MRGVLFTVVLAFVVVALLGLYADFDDLGSSLEGFGWTFFPLVLGLTALNYAVRYRRWEILLQIVMGRRVPRRDNILLFLAGSALIVTPARAGELAKSYFVRDSFGTPVARTAPVILCERVVDVVAMLVLASVGLVLYRPGLIAVPVVLLIGAGALIFGLRSQRAAARAVALSQRLPFINRSTRHIEEFSEGAQALLTPAGLSPALALGLVAWGLECLTFAVVLAGLGVPFGAGTLAKAAFIFPMSNLAGTFSFLPAGLGPADASIAGLSAGLLSLSWGQAVAAAVITRGVILGFPVISGSLAMLILAIRRPPSRAVVAHTSVPPAS